MIFEEGNRIGWLSMCLSVDANAELFDFDAFNSNSGNAVSRLTKCIKLLIVS